jgi:hypothetical protein
MCTTLDLGDSYSIVVQAPVPAAIPPPAVVGLSMRSRRSGSVPSLRYQTVGVQFLGKYTFPFVHRPATTMSTRPSLSRSTKRAWSPSATRGQPPKAVCPGERRHEDGGDAEHVV